jgi:hypothetical protein
VLGFIWYLKSSVWLAIVVIFEALAVWGVLIYMRAKVAKNMNISAWYALTTPLGAGVFAAMMLTSAWKVLSGQGVTWRGRKYHPDIRNNLT